LWAAIVRPIRVKFRKKMHQEENQKEPVFAYSFMDEASRHAYYCTFWA
jgi:hypothetical protein